VFKAVSYESTVADRLGDQEYGNLGIREVELIKEDCAKLYELLKKEGIEQLVLVQGDNMSAHLSASAYLCPMYEPGFPPTVMNISDKRTWVYLVEKDAVKKKIMVYGGIKPEHAEGTAIPGNEARMAIIENNGIATAELVRLMGYSFKRHYYTD
jgi:hypothetical protein